MPISRRKDGKSGRWYYQWGQHGKKYYYETGNRESRLAAHNKALRQAYAAYANGYRKN